MLDFIPLFSKFFCNFFGGSQSWLQKYSYFCSFTNEQIEIMRGGKLDVLPESQPDNNKGILIQ